MSESLVDILRSVAADLENAGERAEAFLAEVRARSLTVTLEAVKAGVPPGKLRDAVAELRSDLTRRADELAKVRLDLTRQTGVALVRAAALAREGEGLGETRRAAALIAWFFVERAGEFSRLAEHGGSSRWLRVRRGVVEGPVRLDWREGEPWFIGERAEGRLPWDPVRAALLSAEPAALVAVYEGRLPDVGVSDLRTWWLGPNGVVGATHDEPPPDEAPYDDGVTEIGRRRVAVATIPAVIAGLEGMRLVRAPRVDRPPTSPFVGGGRGQVLRFPGV